MLAHFLVSVSSHMHDAQHSPIEQQILELNTIMEAFGNAKTPKNHNSSRFISYLNLQFNPSNGGQLESSHLATHLLEGTRVIAQNRLTSEDRNFNIFHQLLKGLSAQEHREWDLTSNVGDYLLLSV